MMKNNTDYEQNRKVLSTSSYVDLGDSDTIHTWISYLTRVEDECSKIYGDYLIAVYIEEDWWDMKLVYRVEHFETEEDYNLRLINEIVEAKQREKEEKRKG